MPNSEVAIVNVLPYIIQLRLQYISLVKAAEKASKQLDDVAEKLDKHTQNVNIAKVSGATGGLVGTLLCVAGFASSFFTFGASLGLVTAGE